MGDNYKSPHKKAKKKKDEKTYRFSIDLTDSLELMDNKDGQNKATQGTHKVKEGKYIYNWLDLITEDKKAKADKARIYLDDDDDEGQLKVCYQ